MLRYELARYLVAGTLAFLSDFTIFLLLNEEFGVHYLAANAAGFCIGLVISYGFCIRWVFCQRTYGKVMIELPVFFAISLSTLLLGEVILLLLVEFAELQPATGKVVMTGIIFLANFVLKKYLLFHRKVAVQG
jgi:putative flippase GtrA